MLKKVLKQYLVKNKLLIIPLLIILFSLILRFTWIDRFPGGMDADQVEVSLSAKTIGLFGVDSSGTGWKTMIFGNNTKAGIAGLPSIMISPLYYFSKLNLTNIRIPFVIINVITIIFLSLLVFELTKEKIIIIFTLLIGFINPWMFAYSRVPTEAPFSLLLIIVGMYFLFKFKGYKIFYSLLFFVGAFYSYFGAKPLLLLLVPVLLIIHYFINNKRNIKIYIFFLLSFILFAGIYFGVSKKLNLNTFSARSQDEILILNADYFSDKVNEYRRASIDYPLKNVLINKYTVTLLEFSKKYMSWISSDFLFWKGDARGMYTFEDHGLIYVLDLLFIVIGIYGISNYKKLIPLLITLFIVSSIPPALSLHGDSFFYRGFLLIPALIILISLGLTYMYKNLKKNYKSIITISVFLIYFSLFVNFLIFYFFRYPVKQQDNNFLNGRIVASYLARNNLNQKVVVVTTSPYSIFNEYLFYSNKILETEKLLSKEKDSYFVGNIIIIKNCPITSLEGTYMFDSKVNCNFNGKNYVVIQNQSDSGVVFRIYNDKLCEESNLTTYRRNHLVSDYNIEKMNNDDFCTRWIQNGKTN